MEKLPDGYACLLAFIIYLRLKRAKKINLPNLAYKPFFVVGIPVFLAKPCLNAVMPNNRFKEKEKPHFPIMRYSALKSTQYH